MLNPFGIDTWGRKIGHRLANGTHCGVCPISPYVGILTGSHISCFLKHRSFLNPFGLASSAVSYIYEKSLCIVAEIIGIVPRPTTRIIVGSD